MQFRNGSWWSINIYLRKYFYSIKTDVPVTSCHHKNFNFETILFLFVALLPSSLVTAIIISMFEQLFTLFHYGTNHLLILVFIIVWLSATVPHSHFVMCYFNRLSGRFIFLSDILILKLRSSFSEFFVLQTEFKRNNDNVGTCRHS
jgi:hypothetical protein